MAWRMISGIVSCVPVKKQNGGHRDGKFQAVGPHEGPDPADDLAVKDPAEHFLFDAVRSDHSARRAAAIIAPLVGFGFVFFGHQALPPPASGLTCRS